MSEYNHILMNSKHVVIYNLSHHVVSTLKFGRFVVGVRDETGMDCATR